MIIPLGYVPRSEIAGTSYMQKKIIFFFNGVPAVTFNKIPLEKQASG